jgi:hypothetical protein
MDADTVRMGDGKAPHGMSQDRMELITLRVAVGMTCQDFGIETETLPVLGKSIRQLRTMALQHERGWNTLLATLSGKGTEWLSRSR